MNAGREPIFNLPGALTAFIALLVVVHVVRAALLAPDVDQWVIWTFGFVPARFDPSVLMGARFPGGEGAKIWSFVSYALLHADLTHLGFNALWLLPFGSAIARRFGAARFYLFLAVTATGGALAHLITHAHEIAPMMGASAAISGAMAAATRFAFTTGSFLSMRRGDADEAARVPALPLARALRNPRVIIFLAVWFGINFAFGIGSIGVAGDDQNVAWQAHIGGFLAGLFLFSLFDPIPAARDAHETNIRDEDEIRS